MENLIGLILPFVIDLVNKYVLDSKIKFVVSFLVCALVAVLFKLPELKAGDVSEVLQSVAVVFAEAQVVYKLYWEKSSLRAKVL